MILDGNNTAGDDDDDGEAGAGKMKVEHSTENTGDTDTAGALLHTTLGTHQERKGGGS